MRIPERVVLLLATAAIATFACSDDDGANNQGSGGTSGDASTDAAGGSSTGGSSTGGSSTGGSSTGGSATGGSATGGSATGGSATGGSATGGSGGGGTGGSATGGTGGSAGDGGEAGAGGAGGCPAAEPYSECECLPVDGAGGAAGAGNELCFNYPSACGDIGGYTLVEGTEGDDDLDSSGSGANNDLVVAKDGEDAIRRDFGQDCYLGGPGDDRLEQGSEGSHILMGGPGADTFAFFIAAYTTEIVDMTDDDTVAFDHASLGYGVGTVGTSLGAAAVETPGYNGTTPDPGTRIVYDPTDGELWHYNGENAPTLLGHILNHNDYDFSPSDFVWE